MAPLHRLLAALSVALLVTGAAGVATHRSAAVGGAAAGRRGRLTTGNGQYTATTRPTAPPTTPSPPVPAGPGTATLQAGLVTPTDMGGYYRVVPSYGNTLVSSAPCLGPLGAARSQSGRALTALLGPDEHSVPTIIEEVASYQGVASRSHYDAAVAAISGCPALSFDFGGATVAARLAPTGIPSVGYADRVWSGSFSTGGAAFTIQIGVVLDGPEVLALLWIDSVPASNAIMGSFVSTVSVAIGKLA